MFKIRKVVQLASGIEIAGNRNSNTSYKRRVIIREAVYPEGRVAMDLQFSSSAKAFGIHDP